MIQTKKKKIYSLLFTFIGVVTFGQQFNTTGTNQFSIDNSLASFNSSSDIAEKTNTAAYSIDQNNSFQLNTSLQLKDSILYPPVTRDYKY
ncbi:hypothetical protein [Flavobacterium sp. ZS1P14]|uniref:hypothetical protein n=1 Tax=Flavobacterium sp. ZS1P14 TaxID=3401729 RepID=UPI003AAAA7F7